MPSPVFVLGKTSSVLCSSWRISQQVPAFSFLLTLIRRAEAGCLPPEDSSGPRSRRAAHASARFPPGLQGSKPGFAPPRVLIGRDARLAEQAERIPGEVGLAKPERCCTLHASGVYHCSHQSLAEKRWEMVYLKRQNRQKSSGVCGSAAFLGSDLRFQRNLLLIKICCSCILYHNELHTVIQPSSLAFIRSFH